MTSETVVEGVEEHPCSNHTSVSSAVACGKCGRYICPRCMVFTPVGVRCRECAQLRKPAQFDVPPDRVLLAGVASLAVSVVAWLIAQRAFFFIWFLAILVGLAVGEAATRIARRRVSRMLEIVVGVAIVAGFAGARSIDALASPTGAFGTARAGWPAIVASLNDPFGLLLVALAVFCGVSRLHR